MKDKIRYETVNKNTTVNWQVQEKKNDICLGKPTKHDYHMKDIRN